MLKLVSVFLKKKLRERIHVVTTATILELEEFGHRGKCLPTQLGGGCDKDMSRWLKERLASKAATRRRFTLDQT